MSSRRINAQSANGFSTSVLVPEGPAVSTGPCRHLRQRSTFDSAKTSARATTPYRGALLHIATFSCRIALYVLGLRCNSFGNRPLFSTAYDGRLLGGFKRLGARALPIITAVISPDVALGKDVVIPQPDLVNLYGCSIGDGTRVGAFVEIQREAAIGRNCKISSHSFVCSGVRVEDGVFIGHGVMFVNDRYPAAVNADGSSCKVRRIGNACRHSCARVRRWAATPRFCAA